MRVWSTAAVPKRESFAFWNDAVCDAFLRVRTERAERTAFDGSITSLPLGPLHVNYVRSERHLVRRSQRSISSDTEGWFFVNLQQTGDCVLSQAGRDQHVRSNGICFFDGVRPFELNFQSDMALTCFLIPREALLARAINAPDAVVRQIPRDGVGALLHRFSIELAKAAQQLSPSAAPQVGGMYLDLLALALRATPANSGSARTTLRQALFASVCADIKLRLADPMLNVRSVAAHAGVAPRTLQTWFYEQGTSFTEYVLEQRLNLAERQLISSANATVSEIAYAAGFGDLSYFSRCFRRRFGMTPSERRVASAS
jgi:AraC family transcriptional regulator, positive regulator of tynA and feaB